MLSLRPAVPSDASLILAFVQELASYEKLAHEVSASAADFERTLFQDPRRAEVVLAEWQQVPVGMALFFHNYSTFIARPGLFLEDLYVRPSHRGRGIGKALLKHVAEIAVARNCGRLDWVVLDWNEPAIGFYRSLGATPQTEWTTFRLAGPALSALGAATSR
jgi:GNAT superfamily N-acetyltransferase